MKMAFTKVFLVTSVLLQASVTYGHGEDGAKPSSLEGRSPEAILSLRANIHHVQGVELDKRHIWVTSVDTTHHKAFLQEFDRRTGELQRSVDITDGARYHAGGLSLSGSSLWIPVAEYKPHSSTTVEERDRKTLELKSKFVFSDHLGCITLTPDGLLAANWGEKLYLLSKDGSVLRTLEKPSDNNYQDMKYKRGILVASGVISSRKGAVDQLSWPQLQLLQRLSTGLTDRGVPMTEEGMSVEKGKIFFLPEDTDGKLYTFPLAKP